MKESTYQETFKTWDKIAKLYENTFMDFDLYNDTYDIFCEFIGRRSNESILEIGCGPGNITRYIATRNSSFKIHAVDVSENMIALAKKNIPSVDFQVMDCRNIADIKSRFGGIICGFTIPYLSRPDCSRLLKSCNNLLREDGIFYLSFVAGDYKNSGYILGSTGDKTYFYYHNLEKIKNELEVNSFIIVNLMEKEFQKSDGSIQIHTIIIGKKVKI
ncbi:class I SAM-dependent DNA methyltransferase [Kriegella aquimaris]|uniref:Methyltransferase domain-containing protein n=1 Tax=Kriegella aquimaris TaxID=192904 RepID=A0A1G9S9P7_9FLAO|nr:class I SAM-dependent methyltransferase [Kriegella aquimaris]SDM32060.1 Methyltransferase domain-containing protein [Kriegella aquimaris]